MRWEQKGEPMVKVFTTNANGKIEFTKEELEKLLNDVWNDGHEHRGTYWWTSPTWTTTAPLYTGGIEVTCDGRENR